MFWMTYNIVMQVTIITVQRGNIKQTKFLNFALIPNLDVKSVKGHSLKKTSVKIFLRYIQKISTDM
jgi:hypothetical protein